jgi:hypothetical protein
MHVVCIKLQRVFIGRHSSSLAFLFQVSVLEEKKIIISTMQLMVCHGVGLRVGGNGGGGVCVCVMAMVVVVL